MSFLLCILLHITSTLDFWMEIFQQYCAFKLKIFHIIYIFFMSVLLKLKHFNLHFVVQSLSHVQLFVTAWTAAHQISVLPVSQSLLELMSIESVIPSNHLILCRPLLLSSVFPSIRFFFNQLVLHMRRPNYWSFIFSISPSNEYSGLISFRIDTFDLLAVQGMLKSLL